MPSHRAAGSVLDPDAPVTGAEALASLEEWEGRLRSRAGWATGPLPTVPAQGTRRPAPAPVTAVVPAPRTAVVPAPRTAGSTGGPARPVVLPPATSSLPLTAPAQDRLTTAAAAVRGLPAPRAAQLVEAREDASARGRRALGSPLAVPPAAPIGPAAPATAPAAVPAAVPAAAGQPSRCRRRAELPETAPPASATVPGAPAAPFEPLGATAVRPRARRSSLAPLDAEAPPPLPARPGSRRALREVTAARPVPAAPAALVDAPPDAPAASGSWLTELEGDAGVLVQLEHALTLPSAERAWTPTTLPTDVRTGEPTDVLGEPSAPSAAAAHIPSARRPDDAVAAPGRFTPARGRGAHRLPTRALSVLPQVGVVGVLGLATLVAPVVGDLLASSAGADAAPRTDAAASASPVTAATALSGTAGAQQLSSRAQAAASGAQVLLDGRSGARVVSRASTRAELAVQQAAEAKAAQDKVAQEKAARDKAAQDKAAADAAARHHADVVALVPGCDGAVPDVAGEANGRLHDDQLCSLAWQHGHRLRSDAAVAFAELDLAYRAHFGEDITLTDSYRSYAEQVRVRRHKPSLAARPGTSEHGWGLAVDFGGGVQDADEHYDWLIANAPKHGWDHPAWARKGGAGPYEPWHWEYVAGEH